MAVLKFKIILLGILLLVYSGCQKESTGPSDIASNEHSDFLEDDFESEGLLFKPLASSCKKATISQIAYVDLGVNKLDTFLNRCYRETGSKKWCDQVARPNPESYKTFDCTYSVNQPHVFVHPEEATWSHAIGAVKLVQDLEKLKIGVDIIYNWWRPEPYNANVGGAAGRHPFGTSVDVRFKNKTEQNKGHAQLCKYRKQGRLRALGYYSGTGLHLGVGDKSANTWGKSCP